MVGFRVFLREEGKDGERREGEGSRMKRYLRIHHRCQRVRLLVGEEKPWLGKCRSIGKLEEVEEGFAV